MSNTVTIHCPECELVVRADEKCSEVYISPDYECSETYVIAECPACFSVLFGRKGMTFDDLERKFVWKPTAERLWPDPSLIEVPQEIPIKARNDLIDAKKCFAHEVYSASVVLCGRALERLLLEKTGKDSIYNGLKDLREQGQIDQRLYEWAEALRKERNLSAHASDEIITKENARDVMDFTLAIFDYIYRLSSKYESYIARKTGN